MADLWLSHSRLKTYEQLPLEVLMLLEKGQKRQQQEMIPWARMGFGRVLAKELNKPCHKARERTRKEEGQQNPSMLSVTTVVK
eukprot:964578-Amphidinium_carterae.1